MLIQKMRRTMMEDEAGQALVIGALTMLILALAVMVTVQLGWTVDQRIRVQNAADNGAYSVAAAVARSLNFISFVNRTSISQYVSMMAAQSISSHVTAIQTLMWMLTDMMESIAAIMCGIAFAFSLCYEVPIACIVCIPAEGIAVGLAAIFRGLAYAGYILLNKTWTIVDKLDLAIAKGVMLLSKLNNEGMWIVGDAMRLATTAALAANVVGNFEEKVIDETAGKCNQSSAIANVYKVGMGALNAGASYNGMFDEDSTKINNGGTEANDDGADQDNMTQNAERLMAELANGTRVGDGRYPDAGFSAWETHRTFFGLSGQAASFLIGDIQGTTRLTNSMGPDLFSEGTANSSSGNSGAAAAAAAKKQADEIKKNKDECKQKDAEAKAARNTCDQDNAACGTNPPGADCNKAYDDCDYMGGGAAAARKEAERDDICNKVKDAADNVNQHPESNNASANLGNEKYNYAWSKGQETTQFTRGGALSSPEYVKSSGISIISGGGPVVTGIQSFKTDDKDHRFHCRFKDKGDDDSDGECDDKATQDCDRHSVFELPLEIETGLPFFDAANGGAPSQCPSYAYTKSIVCEYEDGRHEWYGIAKYLSFNPKPDDTANYFNQPSYWGLVNKSPEDARIPADLAFGIRKASSGNFTFKMGGKDADLKDINNPGLKDIAPGLNGWARAMVYYHRPGFWTEPPNFFNPFWRAKLAPIAPKLEEMTNKVPGVGSLIGGLGLGDKMSKVLTH